jgi:hypothetical protein
VQTLISTFVIHSKVFIRAEMMKDEDEKLQKKTTALIATSSRLMIAIKQED